MSQKTNIYTIYTIEDKAYMLDLLGHLKPHLKRYDAQVWHDNAIPIGEEWKPKDESRINDTHLFLLFVSHTFMYSEFINQLEFKDIIDRYKAGKCKVIPILIDECPWEIDFNSDDYNFSFTELQVMPKKQKPIAIWRSPERALKSVSSELKRVLSNLAEKQKIEAERPKKAAVLESEVVHTKNVKEVSTNTDVQKVQESIDEKIATSAPKEEEISPVVNTKVEVRNSEEVTKVEVDKIAATGAKDTDLQKEEGKITEEAITALEQEELIPIANEKTSEVYQEEVDLISDEEIITAEQEMMGSATVDKKPPRKASKRIASEMKRLFARFTESHPVESKNKEEEIPVFEETVGISEGNDFGPFDDDEIPSKQKGLLVDEVDGANAYVEEIQMVSTENEENTIVEESNKDKLDSNKKGAITSKNDDVLDNTEAEDISILKNKSQKEETLSKYIDANKISDDEKNVVTKEAEIKAVEEKQSVSVTDLNVEKPQNSSENITISDFNEEGEDSVIVEETTLPIEKHEDIYLDTKQNSSINEEVQEDVITDEIASLNHEKNDSKTDGKKPRKSSKRITSEVKRAFGIFTESHPIKSKNQEEIDANLEEEFDKTEVDNTLYTLQDSEISSVEKEEVDVKNEMASAVTENLITNNEIKNTSFIEEETALFEKEKADIEIDQQFSDNTTATALDYDTSVLKGDNSFDSGILEDEKQDKDEELVDDIELAFIVNDGIASMAEEKPTPIISEELALIDQEEFTPIIEQEIQRIENELHLIKNIVAKQRFNVTLGEWRIEDKPFKRRRGREVPTNKILAAVIVAAFCVIVFIFLKEDPVRYAPSYQGSNFVPESVILSDFSIGDAHEDGLIFDLNERKKTGKIVHLLDAGPMTWKDAMKIQDQLGDEWRLPTLDELTLLHQTFSKENTNEAKFSNELYWSSTSYETNQASLLKFGDPNTSYHYDKSSENRKFLVRAVKDFNWK